MTLSAWGEASPKVYIATLTAEFSTAGMKNAFYQPRRFLRRDKDYYFGPLHQGSLGTEAASRAEAPVKCPPWAQALSTIQAQAFEGTQKLRPVLSADEKGLNGWEKHPDYTRSLPGFIGRMAWHGILEEIISCCKMRVLDRGAGLAYPPHLLVLFGSAVRGLDVP